MTKEEFIEQIAKYGQKYYKQFGYKFVSPMIAQACLESAYGTSPKASFNNFFGLKYRKNRVTCNKGYFEAGGSEQNPNGTYRQLPSDTAWYSFENIEMGVRGYYEFLNVPNYAKVREANSPLEYLQEIKKAGYATSLNYVDNVYAVIQKWNLTKYDSCKEPQLTTTPINIIKRTNTHNTTKTNNRKIEWIVLHYTAGTTSAQGAAQNTASYFARTPNQASADFIIDDADIVQYNPDPKNYYCWAVGGKLYSNKVCSIAGSLYGQCRNNNSISIEMCSRKKNTASLAATDNDWYLTDSTVNNAVKLTKYLMQTYNIDINHVVTHCHVTGKWCPQPWVRNENALAQWREFLKKIAGTAVPIETKVETKPQEVIQGGKSCNYTVRITSDSLNVRTGPGTMYSVVRTVSKPSVYTIIAEQDGWGRLKSGAGWISLDYTERTDLQNKDPKPVPAYLVRVTADNLNVRSGPGTTFPIVMQVHRPSIYTIVEEVNGFGKLKSGSGYISLNHVQKL
jgi:N-acetylmuramoyl-L-alanine amidase CwlA